MYVSLSIYLQRKEILIQIFLNSMYVSLSIYLQRKEIVIIEMHSLQDASEVL